MNKYLRISSYIRAPLLIYDFATAPVWISLYLRKILFSFLSVNNRKKWVYVRDLLPDEEDAEDLDLALYAVVGWLASPPHITAAPSVELHLYMTKT